MPRYTNVNDIAEADLAGCLPVAQDPNNYLVLANNLVGRIALWSRLEPAWDIYDVITKESETVNILQYEYVINELQFEFRVARARGPENIDQEKERRLIERWARHVARKKGTDAALDFINQLKRNRENRER